jgi:hypothetical protein
MPEKQDWESNGSVMLCPNPGCRKPIGVVRQIANGAFLLQAGSLLLRETQLAYCIFCNQEVRWSLVDQDQKRRDNNT